ncbi:hypothetical protein Phum_PHUM517920 [Pediculus humanus corporis]|uniref:Monocarboxylate transporter n=1 Tax=Pediculus humanus subsp. corporis TaxID=121224 RepID=E0VYS3_PEDHC|nr:uncharacterized protein Phum_PHUM517920 [Pediculus humanus corporis]EEB18529.1 hypothetical protein Phum_PHUM517920 [Pediculus humanus corporis]
MSATDVTNDDVILPEETRKNKYGDRCNCDKCQKHSKFPQVFGKRVRQLVKEDTIASDLDSRTTLKSRARSWPLLLHPQNDDNDKKKLNEYSSPVSHIRRLLWRHYYPEGGWGYVIVICSVFVHVINHGFQLSFGILHGPIYEKFNAGFEYTGKILTKVWQSKCPR